MTPPLFFCPISCIRSKFILKSAHPAVSFVKCTYGVLRSTAVLCNTVPSTMHIRSKRKKTLYYDVQGDFMWLHILTCYTITHHTCSYMLPFWVTSCMQLRTGTLKADSFVVYCCSSSNSAVNFSRMMDWGHWVVANIQGHSFMVKCRNTWKSPLWGTPPMDALQGTMILRY